MIDVHAHIPDDEISYEEEWEKIRAAQVGRVIFAADTLFNARRQREFCSRHEGAYFTVGIHPSEISSFGEDCLKEMEELLRDPLCAGVGEIGLDYHYEDTRKEDQRRAFFSQLELADRLSLPVQIHSRDACADTLAVLNEGKDLLRRGFLMHCYSYGAENLEAFCALGGYFSFGGVVCFKNARRAAESAKICPLDRILTETDSPYLSPFRGEKNTPANLPVILRKLAQIRGEEPAFLEERTEQNADRLFFNRHDERGIQ